MDSDGTEVGAGIRDSFWKLLESDVAQFLDLKDGLANLVRFDAEDERDKVSLKRDFERGGVADGDRPGNLYSPVSGSAIGAARTSVRRGKLADATKSFPESLSLS